ncbi:uncharacterized protein N7459_007138 [Penicillium hispanicum]|uniref:uncharacterized protein n=1 Tax=Penicillium hispanicum TaxID=1080232 RepID=UPI0025413C92|nr:uncharacterized protein N7459_007138 [Penicillium hispanicum]KAJ5578174.1 hypothetical protein N7459_007138 [Penicillium hispanicum]
MVPEEVCNKAPAPAPDDKPGPRHHDQHPLAHVKEEESNRGLDRVSPLQPCIEIFPPRRIGPDVGRGKKYRYTVPEPDALRCGRRATSPLGTTMQACSARHEDANGSIWISRSGREQSPHLHAWKQTCRFLSRRATDEHQRHGSDWICWLTKMCSPSGLNEQPDTARDSMLSSRYGQPEAPGWGKPRQR